MLRVVDPHAGMAGLLPSATCGIMWSESRTMNTTIWVFVALLCVAGMTVSTTTMAAEPPVRIIFDSDVDHDCDDIGALFMLHGAVQRGEAKLLATICCTSTDVGAPCLDAINTWFGHPEIPVATLKDKGFLDHKGFGAEIARRYPCRHRSGKDYPDAVATYRRILAKEADGSVVILAVGPLRNIANLLASKPDDVSPLDGKQLVAKKVKRLDVMGGNYPPFANAKDSEWNFKQDPASASLVCSTWPTPILFNGEGGSTNSGRRVTFEMPEHNPLTMAYRHYPGAGFAGDRLSWDPVSTLVAIRGPEPWYDVVAGGTNVVDAKTGFNTWKRDANRQHSYLVLKSAKGTKAKVEQALEDLMTAGRARPSKLTFNTASYADAGMCRITARGEADASTTTMKAFDQDERSAWHDKAAASWIQCQYADGRKYRATSYTVVCPDQDRLPASLILSGSNDGTHWTELDVRKAPGFGVRLARQEFTLANTAKWNRYRLDVTAKNANEGVRIATIELNEAIDCQPDVAVNDVTLDTTELSLPANSRVTLNATLSPANSHDREVRWISSEPAVAEVRWIGEQVAMVVGKKPGKCTLTATVGKVKQTCTLTVTPTTLPAGWNYDELNTPAIPGSIEISEGRFTLTGCGHAMTSWWERVRDQGMFVSRPTSGDAEISARLASLSANVGGPNAYSTDTRPPTASGLMIRESLDEKCARYFLIQVDATGTLVCRWRDKSGDQDDNQSKSLGKIALPSHLRLVRTGRVIEVFASADGKDWGKPLMSHGASFGDGSRVGLFVCSGNTFSSATAMYDSVKPTTATEKVDDKVVEIKPDDQCVVVINAGLWPNLVLMPKGRLLMTGFNQPSHTIEPGDADCWESTDGGKTWQLRGTVSKRSDEKSNRALYAVGPTAKGELLAIAGGYGDSEDKTGKRRLLQPVVTRSTDEGKTWEKVADFDAGFEHKFAAIPYGTITAGKDGSLRTVVYMTTRKDVTAFNDAGNPFAAHMVRSDDNGKTWGKPVMIGKGINETCALHLGKGEWIAVARTDDRPAPEYGQELRQYRSTDDGLTWKDEGLLTGYHRHPAHLLRLKNGDVLLSYGNRKDAAIEVRQSTDNGKTWGKPKRVITLAGGDQGYPSSAEREDGKIVTVFYAQNSPLHKGYHAGCVIWKP